MNKPSASARAQRGLATLDVIELLETVSRLGIEELELEAEGQRVRIVGRRPVAAQPPVVVAAPAPAPPAPASVVEHVSAPAPAAPAPAPAPAPVDDDAKLSRITAPMIGTFYRSPAPESPSFVEVGTRVDENTVLCIIEAMKLMNEIKAEARGVVRRILVENGQPVEYGQPMFLIEPQG